MTFKEYLEKDIDDLYKAYRDAKDTGLPIKVLNILKRISFLEDIKKYYKCWEVLYKNEN